MKSYVSLTAFGWDFQQRKITENDGNLKECESSLHYLINESYDKTIITVVLVNTKI